MLKKSADSVSDFKVIGDGKFRRVSVLGMGWEGYTLEKLSVSEVFGDIDAIGNVTLDSGELYAAAYVVVTDDELCKMAHYFYNLGRLHGLDSACVGEKSSIRYIG
jgi:hypothetical protein